MRLIIKRATPYTFLLVVALILIATGAALAQDTSPPDATDEVTPNDINEVARQLWCPLCSGVRLDVCELKACDQMKEVIALKLADGEDVESIKQYFVEQYGPQVLGEPPREGFNWLAWVLPFVALLLGGVFLWRQLGKMIRPAEESAAAEQTTPTSLASEAQEASESEYDRKLDEELNKYG